MLVSFFYKNNTNKFKEDPANKHITKYEIENEVDMVNFMYEMSLPLDEPDTPTPPTPSVQAPNV